MSGIYFGVPDKLLRDKSKLTVKANVVDKDIITADLYLIKRGFFGVGHRLIFKSDLTEPVREIEAKIEKLEASLKKEIIRLEQARLETMDFIRTVMPNVYDDKNIVSRWLSNREKAKKEKDKKEPEVRKISVSLAQNTRPKDNNPNNKGGNKNTNNNGR